MSKGGATKLNSDMAVVKMQVKAQGKTLDNHTTALTNIQSTLDTVLTAHSKDIETHTKELTTLKGEARWWNYKFIGLATVIFLAALTWIVSRALAL